MRPLICDLASFLRQALSAINPLCLAACVLIATHYAMLSNEFFRVLFLVFRIFEGGSPDICLSLTTNSENILSISWIFLIYWKAIYGPNFGLFRTVAFELNVHFPTVGQSVLRMSHGASGPTMLFRCALSSPVTCALFHWFWEKAIKSFQDTCRFTSLALDQFFFFN